MQGTMLWFNVEKGYGFIQTDDGERLYVARSGFQPNHDPHPRCKGRAVSFRRQIAHGDRCAVEVAFVTTKEPRRARRHSHAGARDH